MIIARLNEDGSVYWDPVVLSALDLAATHKFFVDLDGRLDTSWKGYQATGEVSVSAGPWCIFCGKERSCPEKIGLVRYLPTALEDPKLQSLEAMTDERLGEGTGASMSSLICGSGGSAGTVPASPGAAGAVAGAGTTGAAAGFCAAPAAGLAPSRPTARSI